jgi:hypothetical protein
MHPNFPSALKKVDFLVRLGELSRKVKFQALSTNQIVFDNIHPTLDVPSRDPRDFKIHL